MNFLFFFLLFYIFFWGSFAPQPPHGAPPSQPPATPHILLPNLINHIPSSIRFQCTTLFFKHSGCIQENSLLNLLRLIFARFHNRQSTSLLPFCNNFISNSCNSTFGHGVRKVTGDKNLLTQQFRIVFYTTKAE